VEEHRPQAVVLGLQPADDRIAPADVLKLASIDVE
jgi:hypothetical protein